MEVFVETRKSTFEEHMSIVETGHSKSASAKTSVKSEGSILDKLAAELGLGGKAPVAEGEKELPGKNVTAVSPEVAAATDGVANPQLAVAGTDLARQAAGMLPHLKGDINTPVAIATGEGTAITADSLNRTDEAVAAAARGAGGKEGGKMETAATAAEKLNSDEAVKVGELIARSFQQTLEKDAADAEYAQALNILDNAGLLEGYNITDKSITKTASEEKPVDVLEKIANKQSLTRDEIVLGAKQYIEVEKLAADADAEGRELAHKAVAEAIEQEKVASVEKTEQEKVAELAKDPKVVEAVKVLKAAGVLN
jgi:hypothetical protein